ncbi:hypothetical protein [Massilia sp.]|uniref:hypothetical protein n=1 Tax=Massilia sp. TaxID=1882437 RepID=UPI00391BF47D
MSGLLRARRLRGAIAVACIILTPQLQAQSVAFTFDDGPVLAATPHLGPGRPRARLLLAMGRSLGLSPAELGLRLMDDGDFEIETLAQQGL